MEDDRRASEVVSSKLEDMTENLASISKHLQILQGFLEKKFGQEFATYFQLSQAPPAMDTTYDSIVDTASIPEDTEEYEKMPNLVSQESPSRTLGFVTVPLRQTSNKSYTMPNTNTVSGRKRERVPIPKEEQNVLESDTDNEDLYPLHNFTDLLEEPTDVDVNANQTPEFLELELDPSTINSFVSKSGAGPPSLQPVFPGGSHVPPQSCPSSVSNQSSKRSSSRQSVNSFSKYDSDSISGASSSPGGRRASVGSSESNLSFKKYDCHVCGIKFEFAETLKTHLESHGGDSSIHSNSEDEGILTNTPLPLPKLMPRPTHVTASGDHTEGSVTIKSSKSSKKSKSQLSSLANSKSSVTLKRRKRYNQSRPCSLKCPECDLPIRDKSRLIEHLRGHTGERPFECTVCAKAYTRRDVLKTHMLKMHGISSM